MSSIKADSWVHDSDEQVDRDIGRDHDSNSQKSDSLDGGVVAVADGIDHEAADSRPVKNGFGNDGASQQGTEIDAHDGYDWDQGIPKSVLEVDVQGAQSFGSRRSYVVLVQDVEHARPAHPGNNGSG